MKSTVSVADISGNVTANAVAQASSFAMVLRVMVTPSRFLDNFPEAAFVGADAANETVLNRRYP